MSGTFVDVVDRDLRATGWIPADEEPVQVTPSPGRFIRPLNNEWMAVLFIQHAVRGAGPVPMQAPQWKRGMQECVAVRGGVVLAAAERLAAHLGTGYGNYGFSSDELFVPSGNGHIAALQFRGPEDYRSVAASIVLFAKGSIEPWAAAHADLDQYLAASVDRRSHDVALDVLHIPVLLIAAGRTKEALARLRDAERHPEYGEAPDGAEAVAALREFVDRGESIPSGGADLFALGTDRPENITPTHDARYAEFMVEMRREIQAAPSRVRWRTYGGIGLKALREVQRFRVDKSPDPAYLRERWVSVPYPPGLEEVLDRAFERAGSSLDYEVTVNAEARPSTSARSASVDVIVDGHTIGTVDSAALPKDVAALPTGPAALRLSRKPREPKYLVELRLLTNTGQ